MNRFTTWCKQEVDNGEMSVWIMLFFFGLITIGMLIFGIASGTAAL
jgi:hypothetical protein